MNVLWTKHELHKITSKETVTVHAHASGDGCSAPSRCDNGLRNLGDTYMWEGVEARYDQLLYNCFGVTVSSPNCLVCGNCVRHLRSTEKFRALVHAAFDKSPSESTLKSKHSTELPKKPSTQHTYVMTDQKLLKTVVQPPKTSHLSNNNRDYKHKYTLKQTCSLRRANVVCNMCRQRYPAMIPKEGCQKFVCSRCKKNSMITNDSRRCNLVVPENMTRRPLESNVKGDLRTKNRLSSQRKILQVRTENKPKTTLLPKYKCSQCLAKFDMALNLMNHMKLNHGDSLKCICAVCGKELKNKNMLNTHLKEHTGLLFQCSKCLTAFTNNRALQITAINVKCND